MLNTEIDGRWLRGSHRFSQHGLGTSWPNFWLHGLFEAEKKLGNPTCIFHRLISEVAPPIESHRMDNFQIFLELLQQKAPRLAMKAGDAGSLELKKPSFHLAIFAMAWSFNSRNLLDGPKIMLPSGKLTCNIAMENGHL